MQTNNVVERTPMSTEEFEKYLASTRGLKTFEAVAKVKSISRAIRRGRVTNIGVLAPRKPYNNRGNTSTRSGVHSRDINEKKKAIYARIKEIYTKHVQESV